MSLVEQLVRLAQPQAGRKTRNSLGWMVWGGRFARIIHAAAHLGLADHLADGIQDVCGLATATGTLPCRLERLLNVLVGLGIVAMTGDGRYQLTDLGSSLRRDHPESVWDLVMSEGEAWHWDTWGDLIQTLQDGATPFNRRYGEGFYSWGERHPNEVASYYRSLGYRTDVLDALAAQPIFRDLNSVVDVGGGLGQTIRHLLTVHDHLKGTCFDLPQVVASARDLAPMARLTYEAGDAFVAVPAGADAYLLSRVLHCWSDDACVRLLRNCRAAMDANARLMILETEPTPGYESVYGPMDMDLLLFTDGGKVRRSHEIAVLLTQAGLELQSSESIDAPFTLHVAIPTETLRTKGE